MPLSLLFTGYKTPSPFSSFSLSLGFSKTEQQMSADNQRVEDFSCLYTGKAEFIPSFSANCDNICVEIALAGKGNVIS